MPDVFFYEAFEVEAAALKRLLPRSISAGYTDLTIQESGHESPPAALISIRTQSQIPLQWVPKLDAVLSRSTGYDHLTAYAAVAVRPLALGYLPRYCHRAVAEQAVLLWMALMRRLPRQMRQFRNFHRDGLTGGECEGSTLAVVGVGNIGREVAKIGLALGMKVMGVDRAPIHADVGYATIDDALAAANVLVCAMDLNSSNHGYFGMEKWRRARPGAIFVNVSRGELSPSTCLLDALNSGLLAGVGLDVYDHEAELAVALRSRRQSDDAEVRAAIELAQRDDVICTPHNAFNSREAVERKCEHSVEQIIAFRNRGAFLWPVPLQ